MKAMIMHNRDTGHTILSQASIQRSQFKGMILKGYNVIGIANGWDMSVRGLNNTDDKIITEKVKQITNNKNNGQGNV